MGRFSQWCRVFAGLFSIGLLIFALTLVASTVGSRASADTGAITIVAASSLQTALNPIVEKYQSTSQIKLQVIYGSSGKLAGQILNGAPYDIFISADREYPQKISDSGKSKSELHVFAVGYLSVWIRDGIGSKSKADDVLAILQSPEVLKIAIANPAVAPYGRAAATFLENSKLTEKIKSKLVFAESVSQTMQFILSKNVDIAITARSLAPDGGPSNGGRWLPVPDASYSPVPNAMIILQRKKRSDIESKAAIGFFEFMQTKEAMAILNDHGYGLPPGKLTP